MHRGSFGELLLGPALCAAQEFDPLGQQPQNVGLGYEQPLMVSERGGHFCTIRVTIVGATSRHTDLTAPAEGVHPSVEEESCGYGKRPQLGF